MEQINWNPSDHDLNSSQLALFRDYFSKATSQKFQDYESLCDATIASPDVFWKGYLDFSGIVFEGSVDPVQAEASEFFEKKFFPKLMLSYPENLLRNYDDDSKTVMVGLCEDPSMRREWNLAEIRDGIAKVQNILKDAGIQKGDRVAALMPNSPEAVVAMMAATGLGAVWSSCSPDFGEKGVLDRFSQVAPKFLFVADQVIYNGKTFDLSVKNQKLLDELPSVKGHHCFKHLESKDSAALNLPGIPGGSPEFLKVEFNHPLFIMFSSGTTGTPKCIVHGVGGTTLQHSKEHQLHCDLKPAESILYYTTCGWMMWNWVVSSLLQGATLYCYDGSPAAPAPDSMWDLVDREKIDVFGTSAKFIGGCRTQEMQLKKKYSFENLRLVMSTGSPLLPEDFDYFYKDVQSSRPVQLASISGGTDIISCFMLGNPLKPVVRGEIQGRGLGMDVQAWSSEGKALKNIQAELVCCKPFPCMPVSFWNDENNERYRKAYFSEFKNIWHHGDYVELRDNGGIVVYGRSDATLNPGGVRIGTAEIYRQVETHSAIADSIAVGRRIAGDEEVQLFVKMKNNADELTDELIQELKVKIRTGASPRHVPRKIFKVEEIPYTVSGKKVEIAVKKVLHGEDPGNREALANPDSLDEYKQFV